MPDEPSPGLSVSTAPYDGATLLTVEGVLDSTTYSTLRDEIIKAALEEPDAVLVDVSAMYAAAESAWVVFTSARWHVSSWPEVPIMLVCDKAAGRSAIARNGVDRYVPVHASVEAAVNALAAYPQNHRRRARAYLVAAPHSVIQSRQLVAEWLTAWSRPEFIPVAKVIVTSLVENVLEHTDSAPGLRLEASGDAVTVAVEDGSRFRPAHSEARMTTDDKTGLRMVETLCRVWGTAPTPSGKTVWAVIGPENRL